MNRCDMMSPGPNTAEHGRIATVWRVVVGLILALLVVMRIRGGLLSPLVLVPLVVVLVVVVVVGGCGVV